VRRICVVVVAALILGACSGGSGKAKSDGDRLHPKEGEVFLEALTDVGPNPFTKSVALAAVPPVGQTRAGGGSSTAGLRSISGTTSGLFAGSATVPLCEAAAAFDDLLAHDDKSQAWVDALNDDADLSWSGGSKLAVDDLLAYADELTAVILQADTRVTDHAYDGGSDHAFQAVLERGTAVLVDTTGVPRARCASFGPLVPPKPAGSPKYRGEQWADFDQTKLQVVTDGATVTSFRVVEIHTQRIITIPVGPIGVTRATTTTSTTLEDDETTTTTSRTGRSTTTSIKKTTTTARVTTTTGSTTTTASTIPSTTSTTAP
jgi:hypothetical protein